MNGVTISTDNNQFIIDIATFGVLKRLSIILESLRLAEYITKMGPMDVTS